MDTEDKRKEMKDYPEEEGEMSINDICEELGAIKDRISSIEIGEK